MAEILENLEFAQLEKSYSVNVLMKLFVKSQLIALKEVNFNFVNFLRVTFNES